MNDTSGPSAADLSGNHVTGTYHGGDTFGQPSPVSGTGDTAVTFDGNQGSYLVSDQSYANPSSYSEELWFKTTTTTVAS